MSLLICSKDVVLRHTNPTQICTGLTVNAVKSGVAICPLMSDGFYGRVLNGKSTNFFNLYLLNDEDDEMMKKFNVATLISFL